MTHDGTPQHIKPWRDHRAEDTDSKEGDETSVGGVEETAGETEQKVRSLMALSDESEIYVVSEGRRGKWSDWAELREGRAKEVLWPLKGGGKKMKKKIMMKKKKERHKPVGGIGRQ